MRSLPFRTTGQDFAIKIIDKAKCQDHHDTIRAEMTILQKISHPNVVGIIEKLETDQAWFIIIEYMKVSAIDSTFI